MRPASEARYLLGIRENDIEAYLEDIDKLVLDAIQERTFILYWGAPYNEALTEEILKELKSLGYGAKRAYDKGEQEYLISFCL